MPATMIEQKYLRKSVPKEFPSIEGWRDIPIIENNEPLVPLGPFSRYRDLYTDSIYFGERESSPYKESPIDGSLATIFVRQSVAAGLRLAQMLLPKGTYIGVLDGYRNLETQQSLFDRYISGLKAKRPDWSEEQLIAHTVNYVSIPSHDLAKPSPHNTGGSVDLILFDLPFPVTQRVEELDDAIVADPNGTYDLEVERTILISQYARELPWQTRFDHGGEEAGLGYLAAKKERTDLSLAEKMALYSANGLYQVMKAVGFAPLESEWWHWNSKKTQMGARFARLPFAEFGAARLSEENLRHEEMRRNNLVKVSGWEKTALPMAEIILP